MRGSIRRAWLTLLLAGACAADATGAQNTEAPAQLWQAFDLQVPHAPVLVRTGERRLLVYELHLTNFAGRALTVKGIRVEDAADGGFVAELRGEALAASLGRPGTDRGEGDPASIAPGMRAILYLELPIRPSGAPQKLRHRVAFSSAGSTGLSTGNVTGGEARLDDRPLPVIGPPLRGGPWVGVYDPAMEWGHRRVVYAVLGRARIPGRFAIDWMAAPGRDAGAGLGAKVLAVADATVAATRDGVAEPAAGAERPSVSPGDATGNYIALDLGGGRFAFYEHLMPGLLVRPGDRVRRGQVIGRLGSTGQASRPHLHFHLADTSSPLGAEGLPYLLEGVRPIGAYGSIDAFSRGEQWRSLPPKRWSAAEPSFPEPNLVVEFAS